MAFYKADASDDRKRNVIRKHSYNARDIWGTREPCGNFIITGGETDLRIRTLGHAVINFIRKENAPVIILHNNSGIDRIIQRNLLEANLKVDYIALNQTRKNYFPFSGMDRGRIVRCIENLSGIMGYPNAIQIGNYTGAFLQVLKAYEPINLKSILKMCSETDQTIDDLADRCGLEPNLRNVLRAVDDTGADFRRIINSLKTSAENVFDKNQENGISITDCINEQPNGHIISIETGGTNADLFIRCIAEEMSTFANQPCMVVLIDMNINETNGLEGITGDMQARRVIGICSQEVSGSFLPEKWQAFAGRANRVVIFHYSNAGSAGKIADLGGGYEKEHVDPMDPGHPIWSTIFAHKVFSTEKRIKDSEIVEMKGNSAMVLGIGSDIYFVKRLRT